MKTIMNKFYQLKSDERGATAIEYGLIAAGIAVAIIAVVFTLGSEIESMFSDVQGQIANR